MHNQKNLIKRSTLLILLVVAVLAQYCKPAQQASASKEPAKVAVSYEASIKPIIAKSCAPCHFPETGKKKFLDTYDAAKTNITDILARVQLPATDDKFMPFKSKNTPLTTAEVQLLKDWAASGFGK